MAPFGSIGKGKNNCCPSPVNRESIKQGFITKVNEVNQGVKNGIKAIGAAFKNFSSFFDGGRTTISGSASDNSEAIHANKANRFEAEGDIDVTKMATGPAGAKMTKGTEIIKKGKLLFATGDKVGGAVNETKEIAETISSDKDTTVTAKFATEVKDFNPTEEGGLLVFETQDSTATMGKSNIGNFNQQAAQSFKNAEQEVQRRLDERE